MRRVGRPGVARELEREFWEQVPLWESWEAAGAVVGVSVRVARRWVAESGGVKPRLAEPGRKLSYRERCRIEDLLHEGRSQAQIAEDLQRQRSTIWRELKNHSRVRGGYSADLAQALADQDARRPKEAKLATNLPLRWEVAERLKTNHSPEQIAARLREDFPEDPEMWVSHETIYQSLYVQARGGLKRELVQHLRTGRSVRKPHRTTQERRPRLRNMVNISERPPEVEDRAVPGHWEGDLILGSIQSASAIGTLVERATGFVMLLHLPGDHGAVAVQDALVEKMAQLPDLLRRTLTWDQGAEMANHAQIAAPTSTSTSATRTHPGNAAATRTPTGCYASTSPKAATCPAGDRATSTWSPPSSTTGPANASTGALQLKPSTSYYPNRSTHPVLRPPPEFAVMPELRNVVRKPDRITQRRLMYDVA
jgi:transposase, IS30 family